jgi:hypothetical protein
MLEVCCFACCIVLSIGIPPGFGAKKSIEPIFNALNPAGYLPQVDLVPLAPRLSSVEGKTIYLITLSSPQSTSLLLKWQRL